MRTSITLLLFLIALKATAQDISGRVIDEKKEAMINVTILVHQQGILKGGAVTDYDGNYVIKPIEPGFYEVTAIYIDYDSATLIDVPVKYKKPININFSLTPKTSIPPVIIWRSRPSIHTPGTSKLDEVGHIPLYTGRPDFGISETRYPIGNILTKDPFPIPSMSLYVGNPPGYNSFNRKEINQMPTR